MPDFSVAEEPISTREAERAVLGALILGNEARYDVYESLAEADFASLAHATLYRLMREAHEKGEQLDSLALRTELERRGELEAIGGPERIEQLISALPDVIDLPSYAQIVRENAALRRLRTAADEIGKLARKPDVLSVAEIYGQAESQIFALSKQMDQEQKRDIGIVSALDKAVQQIDRLASGEPLGLSSGYSNLDRFIFGFCPGDMIVLAGRPSAGKTAFALSLARTALKRVGVLMFSLEMSAPPLAERLLIMESGVDGSILKRGAMNQTQRKDFARAREQLAKLAKSPFLIDDTPALKIGVMASRARRHMREHPNIGMIVVDYMQLLQGEKTENRTQEVSAISRELKALARELNIPVIALSQLSRAIEMARDSKKEGDSRAPRLSDLRDSGSIEQDADVVIFLHKRRDHEDEGSAAIRSSEIEVHVAKHRNGPTGRADMIFLRPVMRFKEDYSRAEMAGKQATGGAVDANPI